MIRGPGSSSCRCLPAPSCAGCAWDRVSSLANSAVVEVRELPVSDARWRDFVTRHPDAFAFHRPEWVETIAACYRHRGLVLAAVDARGDIEAGVPVIEVRSLRRRRWVALPFTDTCPPLLVPSASGDG